MRYKSLRLKTPLNPIPLPIGTPLDKRRLGDLQVQTVSRNCEKCYIMLMKFEKLAFTYPCTQKPILENFSLQIAQGCKYALIGHNGCGKTTLFRLANGLYRPENGVIRWQEKILQYDRISLSKWRQDVGLVFQDPEQQLVATTVEEDLSYGLCNLGLPNDEIERRVKKTLKDFNLSDLADYPVNYLSLGQKKRLAIADVMILRPKMLLLDEPTAYLDPHQTRELRIQLEKIYQEGTTILLATHDLDFVYDWADWIFVMNKGKLVLEGTPAKVFNHKELLEDVQLGIPNRLKLIAQLQNLHNNGKDLNLEQLKQILSLK